MIPEDTINPNQTRLDELDSCRCRQRRAAVVELLGRQLAMPHRPLPHARGQLNEFNDRNLIEESDEPACLRHTFVSYGESKWIMGWFRQKVPWLSRLALFALAVQIVLSFGHAHLGGVAPASAAGVNAPAVESNSAAAPGPALPIDRDRNSPAHDFCALCASISLLHSLVLPVPAALAALAEFDCIQFRYASATAVLAHPRSPSQARAPPFA